MTFYYGTNEKTNRLKDECDHVLQTGDRGTIKPKANFDAGEDVAALKDAIEGLGTNTHTHTCYTTVTCLKATNLLAHKLVTFL